jgi:putative transposase
VRRIIYTTNAIESLNYQLRKIIKNRGHFPNDQAAVKLLWLAICNIEDKRARERARPDGRPRENRSKSVHKLIEGTTTQGWSEALGILVLNYPDRLGPYLNR